MDIRVDVRRLLSVATAEPNCAICILRSATLATKPIAACVSFFKIALDSRRQGFFGGLQTDGG